MKNRLVQKALSLLVCIMVLMAGLMLISDVVRDRINHRALAVQNVVNSTAGQQTILGPVLAQICTREVIAKDKDGNKETRQVQFQRFALPDAIEHTAKAQMQPRTRGLHQVNTFVVTDQISARFGADNLLSRKALGSDVRSCEAPRLVLPVSDPRGIQVAELQINGQALALEAGTGHAVYSRGLQSRPLSGADNTGNLQISLKLVLLGTERLGFVPLGGTNTASMQANWPHPSFDGNFLPAQRNVQDKDFSANWNVSALASSARESFLQNRPLCASADPSSGYVQDASSCLEQFGTSFIDPVNPYTLSDRATKYGLLFIVLTYVAVAMFEILKKLRVHPVQYLLVGSALSIFFLLLISLSEHIGFARAYAVGACACVALLGYYASHMLSSVWRGLPFAGLIALMYGLLFVLLQLEQTALAVGSIALFVVLTVVMVVTRKVDWYAFGKSDAAPARPALPTQAVASADTAEVSV